MPGLKLSGLKTALLGTLLFLSSGPGTAQVEDGLIKVGEAEFSYLFWRVYRAELFASEGDFEFFDTFPFVLKLHYLRDFTREQILRESNKQFGEVGYDRQDRIDVWLRRLGDILPATVSDGDSITLEVDAQRNSHFYHNGEYRGGIEDAEFSRHFSAIWLSANSSRPAFTRTLTGEDV